jgi:neuronal cell adhesion protein
MIAGEDVRLECSASGYPTPVISWTRDEVEGAVQPNDKYEIVTGGSLLIKSVASADADVYRCYAENTWGRVQAIATLTVLG